MSAQGINKLVAIKKESAWGTKASGTGAQYLPRVTSGFQLEKNAYASNDINPSQQMRDSRHGTRRATGNLAGELKAGSYELLMAAALRKDFAAGATTGAVAVIAVAGTGTNYTRSTGSFVTDGFKVGDIVAATGFTTTNNNNHKGIISALTALQMDIITLDGVVLTDEAEGDTVTLAVVGQKSIIPATGHTDDSFTVEEWYPDETISRVSYGQQVNTMTVDAAPDSMVTLTYDFLGKDVDPTGSAQYFTTPAAVISEGSMSAPDGVIVVEGMAACRFTAFNLAIANNITQESGVGCDGIIAKSRGKAMVTGSITVLLDSDEYLEYFNDESEINVTVAFNAADGEAIAFNLPRMKINSATTDDGEKVILVSCNFEALEAFSAVAGVNQTTLAIVDTTLS